MEKDDGIQAEAEEEKVRDGSSIARALSSSKAARRSAASERRKARQERKHQRGEQAKHDELGADMLRDKEEAKGIQSRNPFRSAILDRSSDGQGRNELNEDFAGNNCDPGYTSFGQRQKPMIARSLEEIPEATDVTQEMDSQRPSDPSSVQAIR